MKHKLTRYFGALLSACSLLILVTGCGEDKKDQEAKSALNKMPGLKKRLNQLDNTLDQMERETDIQRQRIRAAKEEVDLLRKMFARGRTADFTFDAVSSGALVSVISAPQPVVERDTGEEDREDARDSFFRALVILLFGLFSGVYLIKLYRDRSNAPDRTDQPLTKKYETTSPPLTSDAPGGSVTDREQ